MDYKRPFIALAVVGGLALTRYVVSFLRLAADLLILPAIPISKFGGNGSWAVVTGASDGIGKEFATQLAQRHGLNVLLVSRTPAKLDAVAVDIRKGLPGTKPGSSTGDKKTGEPVVVETFTLDLASAGDADYARLTAVLADRDVAVLVNNAGASYDRPRRFLEVPAANTAAVVDTNVSGTMRVTHAVLPRMLARAKGKRGLVLNVGSIAGLVPSPFLAVYSGSKAFIHVWSTALAYELRGTGVTVECLAPGFVVTAMSGISRPTLLAPTPRRFVAAVLSRIGRGGDGVTGAVGVGLPYAPQAFQFWALRQFLGLQSAAMLSFAYKTTKAIMRRAERKESKESRESQESQESQEQ